MFTNRTKDRTTINFLYSGKITLGLGLNNLFFSFNMEGPLLQDIPCKGMVRTDF